MRICHLSDTHLGYRNLTKLSAEGINQREADIYHAFKEAITRIIELAPDAVIHSGDLFDSYHPTTRALGVALDALSALEQAAIPVVLIAGNHSTPRYSSTGHIFEVLARFGGVQAVWGEPQLVRIGELAVYALPHDPDPERLSAALTRGRADPTAKYNVLTLHAGLDGLARVGDEHGAVSLDPDRLELLDDFDYIALGHLHTRAGVRQNACYAGSLERLTFADTAKRKGFYEIDLDQEPLAAARISEHDVSARPLFDLAAADDDHGELAEIIIAAAAGRSLEDALLRIRVAVTQERWRALDMRAVREHFAPCLHLDLQPDYQHSAAAPMQGAADISQFIAAQAREGEDTDELTRRARQLLAHADEEILR